MSLQALGAIGELVGGVGVILSLVYVAYQIRQSSRQIELNSRHMEAAMYYQTGDAFSRWWALLVQDESLLEAWQRGLAGEARSENEALRFRFLLGMLFLAYENSHRQHQLGSIRRDTLAITRDALRRILAAPGGARWWERWAPHVLTREFREALEAVVPEARRP